MSRSGEGFAYARLLVVAFALAGCDAGRADASGPAPSRTLDALQRAFPAVLRRAPARPVGSGLDAHLPARSLGTLTLRRTDAPSSSVEITALDAEDAAPVTTQGVTLYPGKTTDLVHVVEPGRVEELRVLHAPTGVFRGRWRLLAGEGIERIRLRNERVELVEPGGHVALVTDPLDAVDARGTHRTPSASLEVSGREAIFTVTLDTADLAAPVVVDPAWTSVASMNVARTHPTVGNIAPTKVLVHGGKDSSSALLSSAELYDVTLNTWTNVAGTAGSTTDGAVLPLGDGHRGMILGFGIYDTLTNAWTDPGPPPPHYAAAGIGLADGRVLFYGGGVVVPTKNADLFDPATLTWKSTKPSEIGRMSWLGTRLSDGRVMILGGRDDLLVFSSAEIFDPTTETWTRIADAPSPRAGGWLLPLPGGSALAVGGGPSAGAESATVDVYHGATGKWTSVANPPAAVTNAISLSDGRPLALMRDQAVAFDPIAEAWGPAGKVSPAYLDQGLVPIAGGRALVIGGEFEIYYHATPVVQLYAPLAIGAACTGAMECASALCADGRCCDRACTGPCETCNSTGALGTCKAVTGPAPAGHGGCGRYLQCVGGACATGCSTDTQCDASSYCDGTACVPKKAAATACGRDAECGSGFCTDGVCCGTRCGTQCAACDLPGKAGTCTPVLGAPRGTRPACSGAGVGTACAPVCNGKDGTKCNYLPPSLSPCSSNGCKDGFETHASACDGAGACSDTPRSCGAYGCDLTACKSSCASASDCAAGYFCSAGACVATDGLGKECAADGSCASGFCTDGVCCGVRSCGEGKSCATATKGTCAKVDGAACSGGAECGSTHCVDGVCCDAACGGACEACDVPGSFGRCAAVLGKAHGKRSCPTDASAPCASKLCDGAERASCLAFVGTNVICRAASCEAGVATEETRCDGKGACPAAMSAPCGDFVCDPATTTCKTTCTSADDCAAGRECAEGVCKAKVPVCSDDGLSVVGLDGASLSCAPFRCSAGACPERCASTSDCAPFLVCSDAACIKPTTSGGDGGSSGGCAIGGPSRGAVRGGAGSSLVFALLAGVLAWRRRSLTLLAAGAAGAVVGCSNRSASPPAPAPAPAEQAIALSARLATVAPGAPGHSLVHALPARANAPVRIEVDADLWLEVVSLADRDVLAEPRAGASVFVEAARGVDVVRIAGQSAYEELRVVHSTDAPHATKYRLRAGPAVAEVRHRNGRIEVVDRAGVVRLVTDPLTALDASGQPVPLTSSLAEDAGGFVYEVVVDGASRPHPLVVDPSWTTVASMTYPRSHPCVMPLLDGKVLVAGGMSSSGSEIFKAERWDPVTNLWTTLPDAPIWCDRSLRLAGGEVLIWFLGAVSFYLPSTSSWARIDPPTDSNGGRYPAPLADGRLLLAGGANFSGPHHDEAAIFSPTTMTWTAVAPMAKRRAYGAAFTLPDGRVVVAGGEQGATPNSTELYSPSTDSWAPGPTMPSAPKWGVGQWLSTGKALVRGASSELLFDPTATAWSTLSLGSPRSVDALSGVLALLSWDDRAVVRDMSTGAQWPTSAPVARTNTSTAALGGAVLRVGGFSTTKGVSASVDVFRPIALGAACGASGDCVSRFCVDGVCCDRACTGVCEGCALTGSVGTCSGVDGKPVAGHPIAPDTVTCGSSLECTAGACSTTCASDSQCVPTAWCSTSGGCTPKKALGATCADARECGSGNCVDAVCCNTACADQCAACDLAPTKGTCTTVTGAPHGKRSACAGFGAGTSCGPACDGADVTQCHYATAGASCGAATCSGGIETHASTCDGKGACNDVPKRCGAYGCLATTCQTTCATKADCAAGFFCSAGACLPVVGLGRSCAGADDCVTGACVDGVCCGSSSCPTGSSCATAGHRGSCAKANATSCTADAECGSGACVDGVCCESRCDRTCEACDVKGSEGKCMPTTGAPHGKRGACPSDPEKPCAARRCDGETVATCEGFVGLEVSCRSASCAAGIATRAAKCDGKGGCPAASQSACGGYLCGVDDCKSSCASKDDCATGYACLDGRCARSTRTCSPDGTSIIAASGVSTSCAPYICRDDACASECASTADCAAGLVCDVGNKICLSPAAAAEDDSSGCTAGRSPRRPVAWGALLALLALFTRRRPGASQPR